MSNNKRILWLFNHVFAHMPACLLAIHINEALMYAGINNSSTTGCFSTMMASYMNTLTIVVYCTERNTYYLLWKWNRSASDCYITTVDWGHFSYSLYLHWHNYAVINRIPQDLVASPFLRYSEHWECWARRGCTGEWGKLFRSSKSLKHRTNHLLRLHHTHRGSAFFLAASWQSSILKKAKNSGLCH